MFVVRKIRLGRLPELDPLAREAGRIYSEAVIRFWRVVRRQDVWLLEKDLLRMLTNGSPKVLHSQSAQAAIQMFSAALRTWRVRRKADPAARPPKKRKKFFKVLWKGQALRLVDGCLRLPLKQGLRPLLLPWRFDLPKQVEIGWTGREYELRATYEVPVAEKEDGLIASADLGEVHPVVIGTDDFHLIINGRLLRAKRRYREKIKAKFSERIDRKKRGGVKRKKLVAAKQRKLRRIDDQIRDIEQKVTEAAITALHRRGARTLVIGDVRDLRVGYDCGKVQNQRMHQAPMGRIRNYLSYKAERRGWTVEEPQEESYTSQECPNCAHRHRPAGRRFKCPSCGFEAQRDVVGQVNILRKYRGEFGLPAPHVIGGMASPAGLRWKPHLRCSPAKPTEEAGRSA